MRKNIKDKFLLLILIVSPTWVSAETLTMTTYYPSPVGVYQSLRLAPNNAPPTCSTATAGTMYVDLSNDVLYCDGTPPYKRSFGEWEVAGTDLYPIDYATLNVGIGTNLPAAKLHIVGDELDFTAIRIENTESSDGVWEIRSNQVDIANAFVIWGGTEGVEDIRMVILKDGEVGIGTTAPTTDFHVEGNTAINGDMNFLGGARVVQSSGGLQYLISGAGDYLFDLPAGGIYSVRDGTGPTELLTVRQDTARVGINNAAPTSELDVVGTVTAIAFLYSSDKNLKENFKPVSGLDGIMQLEGLSYNWKKDGTADIGITAQDVEPVYPELVHTDESGRKYVKYGNMIAPMIEAIKEQQNLIEQQSQQIEGLRQELDIIKGNID